MTKQGVSEIKSPLVSVVIPFLNREKFLQEAIESIAAQTHQNWELLLIDDASTDKSVEICRNLAERYSPKVHLFVSKEQERRGASATRNVGIHNAKGEYIVFLDSDDVFFPDTIERELKAFEANPAADVVCGTLQFWYSWTADTKKSDRDFKVNLGLKLEKLYEPPSLLIHNLRAGGRKPGITTIMIKREFINSIGMFNENFKHTTEDQVFWAKVSLKGKVYVMDDCLAKYRQHPDSSCADSTRENRYVFEWEFFLDWLKEYLVEQRITDGAVWKILKDAQNNARLQHKLIVFRQAYQRIFPLRVRYWIRDQYIKWYLDGKV